MRVNPLLVPGLFLGVLVGAILIAQLSGAWIVSGRTTIDTENLAVADIKGWMTLQQVIDGVHITREELYALVSIPADMPTTTALKDLEALVPGFETSTLRDALTAKLESAKATPDAASQPPPQPLAQPSTQPSGQPSVQPTAHLTLTTTPRPSATPLPADQVLPASEIKGKMTLREISDQCAIPLDALLKGLNLALNTDPNTQAKALVDQGLVSEVEQVQLVVATLQSN
jgi:hypothetical protein